MDAEEGEDEFGEEPEEEVVTSPQKINLGSLSKKDNRDEVESRSKVSTAHTND